MNLAPIRYAQVIDREGGPIERLEFGPLRVAGQAVYHANAYLSPRLNLGRPSLQLYHPADGAGTHRSPLLARYMAISEAIERWALEFIHRIKSAREYGFDKDPSSNGMSAFPGAFKWQARRRARAEAAERFCLIAWWNGNLPAREVELGDFPGKALRIFNPVSRHKVLLLWEKRRSGAVVYGFSAATSLTNATWKARVELERSAKAVEDFLVLNPGFGVEDLSIIRDVHERRALYFAMPEGYNRFLERTSRNQPEPPKTNIRPQVDREIPGPWSKYATVWRTLYPMPTREYLDSRSNFFFW